MIGAILIAKSLGRRGSSYNALLLSALIILLFDPLSISSISFQFSFTALFSIMLFYKWINQLFITSVEFLKLLWSLSALGISAQILTLPLAIYYFNQFPTYFIVSNVLVVPMILLVFYLAVFYFVVALHIPVMNQLYEEILKIYIDFGLWLNELISELPHALINPICISEWQIVCYYTLIVVAVYFVKGSGNWWLLLLFIVLAFGVVEPFGKTAKQARVITFNANGKNALFIQGDNAVFFAEAKLLNNDYFIERIVYNYTTKIGLKDAQLLPLEILNFNVHFGWFIVSESGIVLTAKSVLNLKENMHTKNVYTYKGDLP